MTTVKPKSVVQEYRDVRYYSEKLVQTLEVEDFVVQAAAHVSPTKWHLAHTTWFFEKFILEVYVPDYKYFNEEFLFLFNSYYETVGEFHPQQKRGLITRPTVRETMAYREHVDQEMKELLSEKEGDATITSLVEIGLQHEQQHQELILMDIKYNFSFNPLYPSLKEKVDPLLKEAPPLSFEEYEEGVVEVGHDGGGFAFDNEGPRHKTYLHSYKLANRPVTNGEFIQFIESGGYEEAAYWLSDGWSKVKEEQWKHPEYWQEKDGQWFYFTLSGLKEIDLDAPVVHVSFYEADAYARWAGKRLPTEQEWEHAMENLLLDGHFMEDESFQPHAGYTGQSMEKAYGDVWEWTQSPYVPYPGNKPLEGALGEYNAKFMANQIVLKGGSCVTPRSHIRSTYRNFFHPHMRWQFSGFRLAEDV
ncbi:ergothioneine biosynthesis protein EgtB [Halobacillus litoralis]|uniref:ergothioneine biosynthesis protein EgtB n=1 Tax=Halobacillus litoralis TaxID=45668 RepID=UPI001CFEB726|nr:ergothioneine biosynthesis protein EgtB [Halobacillus litoralis]